MKKYHFFNHTLIIALFISLTFSFNACKDDKPPVTPEPIPNYDTTILKSKSFEVTDLVDSVGGNYQLYCKEKFGGDIGEALKCSYKITNLAAGTLKYVTMIKKIQVTDEHFIQFCIGISCNNILLSTWDTKYMGTEGMFKTPTDEPLFFLANESTNPMVDSYLEIWSGESVIPYKGEDKFRVIYYNADNPRDFVSFVLTFNFFE